MEMRKTHFLVIIFLIIIQLAVPALAKQAYLSDFVVTNDRDHLLVYFSVNDCFTVEMNRAIDSGMNTIFTFFVKLYEKRSLWWDRKIADVKISHCIKYDNLKRVYEVRLLETDDKIITLKDFDEAKALMASVAALKVTSLHSLQKGGHYQLRMMAELDKIKLPVFLRYLLFFVSFWDFKTDWSIIEFRY